MRRAGRAPERSERGPSRRSLLGWGAGGALAALTGLPIEALAAEQGRRLLIVFAQGGWDPTRALAPAWDTASAMEPDAVPASAGGIDFVDHPDRPSVRAFFEAAHERSVIFRGILVPSVAHEACTKILMTGSTDDGRPDWGAIVASQGEDALLPHLVTSGPSYSGPLGRVVVRTGAYNQLADLVRGDRRIGERSASAIDRVLAQRADARLARARAERERVMVETYAGSADRLAALRSVGDVIDLDAPPTLEGRVDLALDALASGTSRCVTLATDGSFDTHTNNDAAQSPLWEDLFAQLLRLDGALRERTGPTGALLAEDTMVAVVSEMGRTPGLNGDAGKDHWPYTSALCFGAGLAGGQAIGGYDASYEGRRIDPASGALRDEGSTLTSSLFGATLLAAADTDPGPWFPGVPPIRDALG